MKTLPQWGISAVLAFSLSMFAASELPKIPAIKAWRTASKVQEVSSKPVLHNDRIIYGNKTLLLQPDGLIKCITQELGSLFDIGMDFWVVENGKAQYGWKKEYFDKSRSKFYRKDNQYIWELWYGDKATKPFLGITQIVEILPDGRLKFMANHSLPEPTATRKFAIWTFEFSLADKIWKNDVLTINGQTRSTQDKKRFSTDWKVKETNLTIAPNDPAKKFSVQTFNKEIQHVNILRLGSPTTFITFNKTDRKKDGYYTVYFDFRKGSAKGDANAIRGGVNFKTLENMLLPDIHNKNMITNPSLECGLEGWNAPCWGRTGDKNKDWYDPFKLDSSTAYDGKYSLRIRTNGHTWPTLTPYIGPLDVICDPGDYTISFYAKGEPGKDGFVSLSLSDFHTRNCGGRSRDNGKCWWKFPLTPNWKRYHVTFNVPQGKPLTYFLFYGSYPKTPGAHFWLDAVQLERGKKLSAYQPHPVEGGLITSNPDNLISDKDKVNGKFRITTAKPNAEGEVKITVLSFFDEKLLVVSKKFKTGADRSTVIDLPLDSIPGRGLYRMLAEYKLKTGETYYDMRRYTKMEFQNMPRPNKHIFSFDYGHPEMKYDFLKRMDFYRKIGIGAKGWHGTTEKRIWDIERSYGIEPYLDSLLWYKDVGVGMVNQVGPKKGKFYLNDKVRKSGDGGMGVPPGKTLMWDYNVEAGGKITPEFQKKFKENIKKLVARDQHIPVWALGGELTCKFHNEWWGEGYTDRDVARDIAKLLKPFVEAVREASPNAKVIQDTPASMTQRTTLPQTDYLLDECSKIGVRFDMIGMHTYRASPENPDLDDDFRVLFQIMKKHGYDKTQVICPEGMHWGPFDIPQWGTKSHSWTGNPITWQGENISYDMNWTEKKSGAWYFRSWLVALKYADRIVTSTAGNHSNLVMDVMLTPRVSTMAPNTLCAILGDAKFKKDVRFAPYMRTYIFEDAKGRPVAAVWNHHEDVDDGKVDPPFVTADFGDILETVLDYMNSPRAFNKGKIRFQVNSFPLFFRGKPGTLDQMIKAFENAVPDSGNIFKPVTISAVPENTTTLKLTLRNSLSKEYNGTLNGKRVKIPASGQTIVRIPLKNPLKANSFVREYTVLALKSDTGSVYTYDIAFHAFPVRHVDENANLQTLDWSKLPAIQLPKTPQHVISGEFRMGWNKRGLFIETKVKDKKFVHVEYAKPADLWLNDSLQILIDTFANARERLNKGFDEDDYSYGVFPNTQGTAARVFRYRSVESQLGLATQAPPDNTFAPDIPCSFTNKDGVLTYRIFFPAKYLLPMQMQKGWAFGFGLMANNSDEPKKCSGPSLSIDSDGKGCYNRPHVWPVAVLSE